MAELSAKHTNDLLNVYGLNASAQQTGKLKNNPTICCLQETCFKYKNRGWLKVQAWKKISCKHQSKESKSGYINNNQINSRDRAGHSVIKTLFTKTTPGVYTPNKRAAKYNKQNLTTERRK